MLTLQQWEKLINNEEVQFWNVKPSKPDQKNYKLSAIADIPDEMPISASLDYNVPFVMDQMSCPFCAGFGMVNIGNSYFNYIGKMPKGGFSPVFTYWKGQEVDGISGQHEGTTLKAVLDVSLKTGLLPWSYLPFTGNCSKPIITKEMLAEASKYKISGYAELHNYDEICQAITVGKFVLIGTIVTSINWQDGWILEPEGFIQGGHCTFIDKFDNSLEFTEKNKLYKQFLGGVNSWSLNWGEKGKYWMAKYYTEFKLDTGMPCIFDAWAVDFPTLPKPQIVVPEPIKETKTLKMSTSMQVIPPGITVLPFRSIYESLGAKVEWGRNEQGKIWAKATIPPSDKEVIIETLQDSDELKITE